MLELKHVYQQYNKTPVLTDITLQVPKGQFVSIIGPSGAGKTTLLRLFNYMVRPTQGEVWVAGQRLDTLMGRKRRCSQRRVGMIFQDFCLVEESTCLQNVLNGSLADMPIWRVLTGSFPKTKQAQALQALDQVGLADKAYCQARSLSGGQKQRVAIARTLMQNADVVLADEPVASLDPVTARQILGLLRKLQQEKNLTIVMNSHHVEQAKEFSDRIIGLKAGKIMADHPAQDWQPKELDALYRGEQHDET